MINAFEKTYESAHENMAYDELLLYQVEQAPTQGYLRFWESDEYYIVLGHANRISEEINRVQNQLTITRRCTGGGTIVQGPGCLNYSLIIPISASPLLRNIQSTNQFVMGRHQQSFRDHGLEVSVCGVTDLTFNSRKFSGNAQKRIQNSILFHGSILYQFDLDKISRYLSFPPKVPEYRQGRSHAEFLVNLPLTSACIKTIVCQAWGCKNRSSIIPDLEVFELANHKYSQQNWIEKFL